MKIDAVNTEMAAPVDMEHEDITTINNVKHTIDDVNETVNDTLDNINNAVTTVHKVSKIKWKTIWNWLFKGIVIAVGVLFITFIISIVHYRHDIIKWIGDAYVNAQVTVHDKNYNNRLNTLTPKITETLKDMYYEVPGAEMCFMMEFHNGGNNIANIPFCKGTVTYNWGNVNSGITIDGAVWSGVQLTNFFSQVCKYGTWRGYVTDINNEDSIFNDPSFYKRASESGIAWLSVQVIYNAKGEKIGILGVCCNSRPEDTEQLNQILIKYSQYVSREYSDMIEQ